MNYFSNRLAQDLFFAVAAAKFILSSYWILWMPILKVVAHIIIIIIIGYIFATIISQNKSDKTKDTKVVGTDIKMITIVVQYLHLH